MVPMIFLNANRFEMKLKMELDSNHQSNLVFSIYLKTLQIEEESAIGQKEVFEFGFGMEITKYENQEAGICWVSKMLFEILVDRNLSI
jgi:hypothetical protein